MNTPVPPPRPNRPVYLDNQATTRCDPRVVAVMMPWFTEHYGNPAAGLHAIQLEINRALYMDERRYQRSSTFDRLAADLETLARRLGEIPLEQLRPYRAAAE